MESNCYYIYKITNTITNKVYIGLTGRDPKLRYKEHIWESWKGKEHHNHIHAAFRKYNKKYLVLEILESNIPNEKIAEEREIYYINKYDSFKNGYNMTEGGYTSRPNFKHSDEAKEKMRKSHLGKIISEDTKLKISKALKGKPKSPEHRLKVIKALTGLKKTTKQRKEMSKRMIGKYPGNKNPAAIIVKIFNEKGILMYTTHGNFEKICTENGLPTKALRKSYYTNGKPIYTGKTIKKEVLIKNKKFIGWFAIKTKP